MKTPLMMSALFFAYALTFIQVLAIAAQARTLSDSSSLNVAMINIYGRRSSPPSSSRTKEKELTSYYEKLLSPPPSSTIEVIMTKYGRTPRPSPPPPRPSTPKGQLEISSPCPQRSSCNSYISIVTDYGRRTISPPAPPRGSPPPRQTSLMQKLHPITSKSLLGFN